MDQDPDDEVRPTAEGRDVAVYRGRVPRPLMGRAANRGSQPTPSPPSPASAGISRSAPP